MCPSGNAQASRRGAHHLRFRRERPAGFLRLGMANDFIAYSPITGATLRNNLRGPLSPPEFVTGETLISTRCYGGNGAEVVVW